MIAWTLLCLVASWIAAMTYVYRYRGRARYASLKQYLRKSWPVFALPNVILYTFTKRAARGPFVALDAYPTLASLAQHWDVMRDEALAIQAGGSFEEARREGSVASFDVGFRTFYKYGWSRYYLRWYGYTHASARASCPQTLQILAQYPQVKAAMFAILPPHSGLTPHADPLGCSLRYHLGLATPNAAQCFIDVDGQTRAWHDGQAFIFDETYLHFVRNDTDAARLILMCDVARPMRWPGRLFNLLYCQLARAAMTPNDTRDKRGPASALFTWISPLMARGKQLRARHRPTYNAIKWAINLLLLSVALASLAGVIGAGRWLLHV
ncbi:aspartyl/asparaginyl beta-hydroxylase domain-containing protein [Xanthomonas hortorum]|uniref:aspartyl/asparaginyl beta-hydroxylase domain-containing protein n=1 Tax=Xanthomonas hortorum TaxID=56454 RepID=UPI0015944F83|nr:aspartyl/asparaginyl beta-hydroxylase domain-containing protein [Xanthomonas hortorum]NHF66999.1 aspartyl/asparaginyl beta-hydroxylase domain-containing protein [Xanthomonas hortorum]